MAHVENIANRKNAQDRKDLDLRSHDLRTSLQYAATQRQTALRSL
jgi:hypothetical protein